jgi:hypothetical protein
MTAPARASLLRWTLALAMMIPLAAHAAGTRPQSRRLGAWAMVVRNDPFSGYRACRLGSGPVDYRRQALVFHLSHRTDTSGAVYRIDDGPPIWARSDAATLAHLGFALHADDLANPSGGLVRIPAARLAGAKQVRIEAKGRVHAFRIAGFEAALAAARSLGCTEEAFD